MRVAPYVPSHHPRYGSNNHHHHHHISSSENGYNSSSYANTSDLYTNHRHKHQPYQTYDFPPLSSSPTTVPTNVVPSNKKHALIISPSEDLSTLPKQQQHPTTTTTTTSNRFIAQRCVALDCEMVGVGPGGNISVLARVSVVDWYGRKIYDAFVHVEEKVTDYRTHVSGVTEQDVKGAKAMNFGIVRKQVKQLLKNKIIVGHGLENDLRALKIEQDFPWYNIRDSATQYQPYLRQDQFGQWLPRRLRDLAWYHLGIVIQQEGKPHDSLEDARASMALYRLAQPNWDYEMDCRRRNMFASAALPHMRKFMSF
jgi:DNA polymerase III epsilon subunit-like protein